MGRKQVLRDPRVHNLLAIANSAGLNLTTEQQSFLDEVTTFNIRARYPDYKNRFYKTATHDFTYTYITKISDFREWLLQKIAG